MYTYAEVKDEIEKIDDDTGCIFNALDGKLEQIENSLRIREKELLKQMSFLQREEKDLIEDDDKLVTNNDIIDNICHDQILEDNWSELEDKEKEESAVFSFH